MPEMYPSKLAVPYAGDKNYEFTLHREETIAQFNEKVLQSCPEEIKSFELIPCNTKDKQHARLHFIIFCQNNVAKFKR